MRSCLENNPTDFNENGLLSYENPNYHLDPARLESALYDELFDMRADKLPHEFHAYMDNRSARGAGGGAVVQLAEPLPRRAAFKNLHTFFVFGVSVSLYDLSLGPDVNEVLYHIHIAYDRPNGSIFYCLRPTFSVVELDRVICSDKKGGLSNLSSSSCRRMDDRDITPAGLA
ncbi:hypothetical protein EVAR_60276_1 [Eumeta japonica]|uniref:Uncharacterized protein n=1 Tax=Eumeta variegata TaxID=151549 RepID=A0A4C1ZDI2_EUMVA|nr:hypothetical protein EVAR_60276_1 [Eumeta japonica]